MGIETRFGSRFPTQQYEDELRTVLDAVVSDDRPDANNVLQALAVQRLIENSRSNNYNVVIFPPLVYTGGEITSNESILAVMRLIITNTGSLDQQSLVF